MLCFVVSPNHCSLRGREVCVGQPSEKSGRTCRRVSSVTKACKEGDDESTKPTSGRSASVPRTDSRNKRFRKVRWSTAHLRLGAAQLNKRVRDLKEIYRDAKAVARALENLQPNEVLGADISGTSLGFMSTVQDLVIPPCPDFTGLKAQEVTDALRRFVSEVKASDASLPSDLKEIDKGLPAVLGRVRLEMIELAENGSSVFKIAADGDCSRGAVSSFLTLLYYAKFHCEAPATLSPPSVTALPLQVSSVDCLDPTIFGNPSMTDHPLLASRETKSSLYPHVLVCTRGTGVSTRTGPLLGAKIRSIEQLYLGWLDAPFHLIGKLFGHDDGSANENEAGLQQYGSKRVRRVFPSTRINLGKGPAALMELALPIFTQEPTHRLCVVAYREVEPNEALQRAAWREEFVTKMRDAVSRAVNPVKYMSTNQTDDKTQLSCPLGEPKPLRLEIYHDVQWGEIIHFFPSCCLKVVLQARDILRLDLLTLTGIFSFGLTLLRDVDDVFVKASALGTVLFYIIRIAFTMRRALTMTRYRVSEEKVSQIVASDEAALTALAALAADQVYAIVGSAYVARLLDDPKLTSQDVARKALKLRTEAVNDEMVSKLVDWALGARKTRGQIDINGDQL